LFTRTHDATFGPVVQPNPLRTEVRQRRLQGRPGIPRDWIDWCPGHYEQFGRYRDGEITTLVAGERRTIERDEQGRPWKEIISGRDERGREFHMEGAVKNHLCFQGFPEYWWWCLGSDAAETPTGYGSGVSVAARSCSTSPLATPTGSRR
jgi:hypothetical protein